MNYAPLEDEWDEDEDGQWDPEYYFLHPNQVARIVYDEEFEDYTISEAMGPEGVWFNCDVDRVLNDGDPISEKEAADIVAAYGGDW